MSASPDFHIKRRSVLEFLTLEGWHCQTSGCSKIEGDVKRS